ncbi:MAG: hypothetical protein WAK55_21640 [Xanthobacteraceae bacterium]
MVHRHFTGEWLHLKIAVSMVLVFAFLASQPAFAKQARAPAHASPHAPSAGAAPAKATNAGSAKPAEPIDADVTVLTPRGGFTPVNRNAKAELKIVKPENFTRRPNITAPIKPIVRNAIGQLVQSRSVLIESPRLAPSVQVPGAVPKAITRSVVPAPTVAPSTIGRTPFHPTTTVGISSTGRIDGARLIRPSAAPTGIGGPAHPAGGINGTTVRTTR